MRKSSHGCFPRGLVLVSSLPYGPQAIFCCELRNLLYSVLGTVLPSYLEVFPFPVDHMVAAQLACCCLSSAHTIKASAFAKEQCGGLFIFFFPSAKSFCYIITYKGWALLCMYTHIQCVHVCKNSEIDSLRRTFVNKGLIIHKIQKSLNSRVMHEKNNSERENKKERERKMMSAFKQVSRLKANSKYCHNVIIHDLSYLKYIDQAPDLVMLNYF